MTIYTLDDFLRDNADILHRMSDGTFAAIASGQTNFTRNGRTVRVGAPLVTRAAAPLTHRQHAASPPPVKKAPTAAEDKAQRERATADDWGAFKRSQTPADELAALDALRRMGGV